MSTSSHVIPPRPPLRIMAAGTAVAIASLYLSQPILNLLGKALHGSVRQMGFITTASQIGFALGIIFLVPLGDILPKRRLILTKLLLASIVLVATGCSQSVGMLTLASLALGLLATAAQDLVPLAAELSAPAERGKAIGIVMGGLLLGILGSRIFSGVVADLAGWRAPFFAAAGLALVIAGLLAKRLPVVTPSHAATYPQLLRSMGQLVSHEPLLRLSTLAQGCMGLTFSAFWTMLSYHLGGEPFHLNNSQIGLFALAGFAGAAAAPVGGRLADRHGPLYNLRLGLALTAAAFATMLVFPRSLAVLALTAVVFDLGVQLSMVSHQTIIYGLQPAARSRINAVFVGGLFCCFALGSFGGALAYSTARWTGVVLLCLCSCAVASVLHAALTRAWRRRTAPVVT